MEILGRTNAKIICICWGMNQDLYHLKFWAGPQGEHCWAFCDVTASPALTCSSPSKFFFVWYLGQSHVAFSGDQAKRLDRSCFMFPHGNPTCHCPSSSRATEHLWARESCNRSLLYFWAGITGKCVDQWTLGVLSSQTCQEKLTSSRPTAEVQVLSQRLQIFFFPPFFALGQWVGGGEGFAICIETNFKMWLAQLAGLG